MTDKELEAKFEKITWNLLLEREKNHVLSLFFRNPDMFRPNKPITKAAISGALLLLDSIPQLGTLWFASPIDKTGGILFVCSDEKNTDSIVITERGTLLRAKEDVKKYMDYNKI